MRPGRSGAVTRWRRGLHGDGDGDDNGDGDGDGDGDTDGDGDVLRIWQCSDGHAVCEFCRKKPQVHISFRFVNFYFQL